MAFTVEEVVSVANSLLDLHERGKAKDQAKQARPMLDNFVKMQKFFGASKEFITTPVRMSYTTTLQGFSHDDSVGYRNPANTKRASYVWRELHAGIEVTLTELKQEGLSIVDSTSGMKTSEHSDRELVVLTENLQEKIYDLDEGAQRDMALIVLRDGTQDAKEFPGLRSLILDSPSTGTTGGIDRALNSKWRNRANLLLSVTTPSDMVIARQLQQSERQLRRYAPKAKLKGYMGSSFIDAMEQEARAKGTLTQQGWQKGGPIDMSIADIRFKNIEFFYDPTLDDEGLAKYCFIVDHEAIKLRPMQGEEWKDHSPARPPEKYVVYKAKTWTGGMTANQLNSSEVLSIV